MTNNTLDQIKEAEQQAERIVAESRLKAQNSVSQAVQNGIKILDDAENQVGNEIEDIVKTAKKEIQNLKVKQERNLATQLQKINNIDEKAVKEAASLIVKKIIK